MKQADETQKFRLALRHAKGIGVSADNYVEGASSTSEGSAVVRDSASLHALSMFEYSALSESGIQVEERDYVQALKGMDHDVSMGVFVWMKDSADGMLCRGDTMDSTSQHFIPPTFQPDDPILNLPPKCSVPLTTPIYRTIISTALNSGRSDEALSVIATMEERLGEKEDEGGKVWTKVWGEFLEAQKKVIVRNRSERKRRRMKGGQAEGKYVTFLKDAKLRLSKYKDSTDDVTMNRIKRVATLHALKLEAGQSSSGHSGVTGFSFLDGNDYHQAVASVCHVLEHMQGNMVAIDKRIASTAMMVYSGEGRIQRAKRFVKYVEETAAIDREPWMDKHLLLTYKNSIRRAHSYLMKFWGKSKWHPKKEEKRSSILDEVNDLYTRMEKRDAYDVGTYLDCLANLGESKLAEAVFEDECRKGVVQPDPAWVNAVIYGGGVDYDSKMSMRVFNKYARGGYRGLEGGVVNRMMVGAILGALSYDGLKGSRWQDALKMLQNAKDGEFGKIIVGEAEFGKVLSSCAWGAKEEQQYGPKEEGYWEGGMSASDGALKAWGWMDLLGVKKTKRHYYYMVSTFACEGDLEKAQGFRDEMCQALGGDENVDTMLAGYLADEGMWDELEVLIEDGHVELEM